MGKQLNNLACRRLIIQEYTFTESTSVCHWWCGDYVRDCSQYNATERVRFGDTEDCTKYYQCYESELTHNECPEPWFFDCETDICNWEQQTTCQPECTEFGEITF